MIWAGRRIQWDIGVDQTSLDTSGDECEHRPADTDTETDNETFVEFI